MARPDPNPGSPEARKNGCICPVLDNCHGKFPPMPPDGWYWRLDCPLHGDQAREGLKARRKSA